MRHVSLCVEYIMNEILTFKEFNEKNEELIENMEIEEIFSPTKGMVRL